EQRRDVRVGGRADEADARGLEEVARDAADERGGADDDARADAVRSAQARAQRQPRRRQERGLGRVLGHAWTLPCAPVRPLPLRWQRGTSGTLPDVPDPLAAPAEARSALLSLLR